MVGDKKFGYKNNLATSEILAFSFALIMSLAVFLSNYFVQGPIIQADEGSYIAGAAALAGFRNDMAGSYHTGYSMLLSPAFLVADTPGRAWTLVKAINSILFFMTVVGLWLTAKYLKPEMPGRKRLAAVMLVSLYPMWVTMAGYAFAQNAFVPFFLLVFLCFLQSISGGVGSWVVLGLASGFLYWVHPTAVAPLIAVSISAAYITWSRRNFMALISLILTITVMVLIYKFGVTPWFHEQMTISGFGAQLHYPDVSLLLATFTTIDGMIELIARMAGQLFYVTVGTVGLIWLGLFDLTERALKKSRPRCTDAELKERGIAIFLWLTILGTVAVSAMMLTSLPEAAGARLDQWMYGRYLESMIAPILLVGVFSSSFRKIYWAIPLALLLALLLSFGLDDYIHTAPFNISAFWQEFFLREEGLWIWLVAGCTLMIIVASLPRTLGILLIAAIFSFSNYLQIQWHVDNSDAVSNRWDAAKIIRDQYEPGTCVGFDHSGIDSYRKHVYWFDFGLILFDYDLKRISFDQWLKTCDGPLLSYDMDLEERGPVVYPIVVSSDGGPSAWIKGRAPSSIYPMFVSDRSSAFLRTIGSGWYGLEEAHVWSGPKADLRLPIPKNCDQEECVLRLTISVYGASETRPVKVIIQTDSDDFSQLQPLVLSSSSWQKITIPLPASKNVLNIIFRVPDAISPLTHDKRVLGIALQSIELLTL